MVVAPIAEPHQSLNDMPTTKNNPWKRKAADLDRFRWLLLRERHGLLGSSLRFIRDAILDMRFGLRAKRKLLAQVISTPCDFLLLQSAPKIIGLKRKKLLIEAIRERGYALTEIALPKLNEICINRQLIAPPGATPLRYFGYAAHAAWIVEQYQPRILLNDRNGSLYSPFLRLALNEKQKLLVHLAHATTGESSRRLSMNDYDFYFLFGPSSLAALQARTLRLGTSTAVLAGSHMVDTSFDLPPANAQAKSLLILGVGPDREKEEGYQRTYSILREWADENPDYHLSIKCHPRSSAPFWRETAKVLSNVTVLPSECSLAQALSESSIVVNIMSNAVIEAGLAGRPVIYCNLGEDRDIFDQERFFGRVVVSTAELRSRVKEIESNFFAQAELAHTFANFHLAHGLRGLEENLRILECLVARSALPDGVLRCTLSESIKLSPSNSASLD